MQLFYSKRPRLPWTGLACILSLQDKASCILPFPLPGTIRILNPKLYPRSSNTWLSTRLTPSRGGSAFDRLDLLLPCSNDLLSCLVYSKIIILLVEYFFKKNSKSYCYYWCFSKEKKDTTVHVFMIAFTYIDVIYITKPAISSIRYNSKTRVSNSGWKRMNINYLNTNIV